MRSKTKTKKNSELVVWGELWDGDSPQLVFALERDASRAVKIRDALGSSQTFGDLKRRLDPEDYKHVEEGYSVNLWQFEKFCADCEFDPSDPKSREEYLKLELGQRLPVDEDPFDERSFVGDGDWPEPPTQLMLGWMPMPVLKLFAEGYHTMLDGPSVRFELEEAPKIVAELRKCGYRVRRDDSLVDAAQCWC
jgi:hypothetical protein